MSRKTINWRLGDGTINIIAQDFAESLGHSIIRRLFDHETPEAETQLVLLDRVTDRGDVISTVRYEVIR